jgi:hypothetical protein
MLAVSERLAPRYAVKPGVSSEQLLEVQGMTCSATPSWGICLSRLARNLSVSTVIVLCIWSTAVPSSCARNWAWRSCRKCRQGRCLP